MAFMHSKEQRSEAVRLFKGKGQSYSAVIGALGYGSRWSIDRWVEEFEETATLHEKRIRYAKFTNEQKVTAVEYHLNNDHHLANTVKTIGYPSRALFSIWIDVLGSWQEEGSA